MPHVDSLLSLAQREGADELRIGTDRQPQMFAGGTPKRLTIPATTQETLRHLLGEILGADEHRAMREAGATERTYTLAGVGTYDVKLSLRDPASGAIDARFLLRKARKPDAPAVLAGPAAAAAPAAASPASAGAPATVATAPSAVATAATARPSEPSPDDVAFVAPEALRDVIEAALARRASDVHLAPEEAVVLRVDGALEIAEAARADITLRAIEAALTPEMKARLAAGRSSDVSFSFAGGSGKRARVRMNSYLMRRGIAHAVRLLPPVAPSLADLNLSVIQDLASLPNGLVLVSGPTGSGKSSTLAALAVEAIRVRPRVLVTLEDPVEYEILASDRTAVVRQREIGKDVRDFATGLRDALREDPDIILVGEMRDAESIELALTAAETGHLVLATLHSRGAASAIERILDGVPRDRSEQLSIQLADALRAVVAQRLIPRARGQGRIAAYEIMRLSRSVASAIRENKLSGLVSAMQAGKKEGMVILERQLADLVQRGEITLEAAQVAANDRELLRSMLG